MLVFCVSFFSRPGEKRHTKKIKYHAAAGYGGFCVPAVSTKKRTLMTTFVGLDIGGTKLMVAAADAAGTILRRTRASTPLDLDAGLSLLNRMIAEVAAGDQIA